MNLKQMVLALVSSILLGACASPSTDTKIKTTYYVLNTNAKVQNERSGKVIMLEAIKLSLYLKRRNLITLDGRFELIYAKHHLWAEDLQSGIWRVINDNFNQRSAKFHMVSSCKDCKRVSIEITEFFPSIDGEVVLNGYFTIYGNEDLVGVSAQSESVPFSYKKVMEEAGYKEAVRKMSGLLSELAIDLDRSLMEGKHEQ